MEHSPSSSRSKSLFRPKNRILLVISKQILYLNSRFQSHVIVSFELVWLKFRPLKLEPFNSHAAELSSVMLTCRKILVWIDSYITSMSYYPTMLMTFYPFLRFKEWLSRNFCPQKTTNLLQKTRMLNILDNF